MADHSPIDFADLSASLLQRADRRVPQWLPDGRRAGHEWVCGSLSGGEGRSCSVNLVTGKWADFSSDDAGTDLVSLYAAIHQLNQGQAARQLMRELGWQRGAVQTSAHKDSPQRTAPDASAQSSKRKSMWRAVVPVPDSAPDPDFKHWHYAPDDVVGSWAYRLDGVLFGYVVRYRTSDGGKAILPCTWCVDESDSRGTRRWHFKQWDGLRPLYVPAGTFSDPQRPVVVVEGEKCAQAGHELLGAEFDFVTWPGGAKAWQRADWQWISGRTVYLWPDCDAKREPLTREERAADVPH